MNNYFMWNGVSSAQYGIVVKELPPITFPQERVSFTDIPGRNGSIAVTEGADIYADLLLSCECYVPGVNNAAEIGAFLRGSGRVFFPNRPSGYYEARIVNQIPFKKIVQGNPARTFPVNFRCKPMYHLATGDTEQTVSSGSFILNPTSFAAKPIIKIVGSGDIYLLVGSQIVSFSGIESGVVLDCEDMEAYWEQTSLNHKMLGEFPVLPPGSTAVSWTGTVSSVKLTPRWVTLL